MVEMVITEGAQVTLHFALVLENGDIVDSNFDGEPATFAVGDGSLLPGFEHSLFGMASGENAELTIPPEKAFGQPNPNNIQHVDRSAFSEDFELAQGLVVSFADAAGSETPGIIVDADDKQVTVDFNHPLAGKSILFKVEIIAVVPAVTH